MKESDMTHDMRSNWDDREPSNSPSPSLKSIYDPNQPSHAMSFYQGPYRPYPYDPYARSPSKKILNFTIVTTKPNLIHCRITTHTLPYIPTTFNCTQNKHIPARQIPTMNWASIARTPPPPPTPKQRWDALTTTYAAQPLRLVLLEVLGLLDTPLSEIAAPLIEHCVLIVVDTEAWTANTDEMTEIGLVVAEHYAGKALNGKLGDFGEEVLKKMKYYHLRICENAHLKTSAAWMRGAAGNRFGSSRFVTFAEAREILDILLNQPIISSSPSLTGLKRPVILMGHAVSHDTENMGKSGLKYNFKKHGTVVAEIDTQTMVKEAGCWFDKKSPGNDIGLDRLCEEVFGFKHEDAHTALNDAARTVVCGVNLALRNFRWKKEKDGEHGGRSMQDVALGLEAYTQATFSSPWGSVHCCTRCGSRAHSDTQDQCKAAVYCNACDRFDETTLAVPNTEKQRHISSHIETFCLHVAEYNAWKRRVYNADRKHNELPPGPPPGSHPGSSWRGKWPMEEPSDVLLPEMSELERITRPRVARDVAVKPAPVVPVKVVVKQSDARERAVQVRKADGRPSLPLRRTTTSTTDGSRASSQSQGTVASDDAWNGTAW